MVAQRIVMEVTGTSTIQIGAIPVWTALIDGGQVAKTAA